MDKKARRKKRDYDFSVKAFEIVQKATAESSTPVQAEEITPEGKNAAAVVLGSKGGKARAQNLTAEQRRDIAKVAAKARWKKS
jgi:hypothetical protein